MLTTQDKQPLRVKSYFAASFQEAMKQAQQEMGPDALLLNSRETLPEARHLGAWEVVFGAAGDPPKHTPAPETTPPGEDVMQELQDIRVLLKRLTGPQPVPSRSHGSAVSEALIDAGLERSMALEIEEAVMRRVGQPAARGLGRGHAAQERGYESLMIETAKELAGRIEVRPDVGKITALVGPPGAGKTLTIVKLAVIKGLLERRTVRLITTDTRRIGAVEQLRTYAEILGVPFQAAEDVEALARAIDSGPAASLTLIDTPGFTSVPLAESDAALSVFLKDRQDIDTHLVLTASMRPADLTRTADRFEIFSPSRLLFTKIDETDSFGALYREAACRQKPLSFFSDGLLIPENIRLASKEQVVDALVRHLPDSLRLVA